LRNRLLPPILSAFLRIVSQASAQTFSGLVVGVTDWDTLRILHEKKELRVRVWGIDALERRQPFGTKATQYASDLAYRKAVSVHDRGRDSYGRLVASITLPDGRDFGVEMVRAGLTLRVKR
jgi:endonuclease YncB( thermonuclease family)